MSIWDSSFKQAPKMSRDRNFTFFALKMMACGFFVLMTLFADLSLPGQIIQIVACIGLAMSATIHLVEIMREPSQSQDDKNAPGAKKVNQ